MFPKSLLHIRRPLIIGLHLLFIPLAFRAAFALRFEFVVPTEFDALYWRTLPYLLAARLASFLLFGLYTGWWRHVGMRDLTDLVKAVSLSSALFLGVIFFTEELAGFPRSVLFLDWLLAVLVFGGARFLVRAAREKHLISWRLHEGRRTLVVGAGDAAERLLRQIQRDGLTGVMPVALVDDDPAKRGMRLHGVPVLGASKDIQRLVRRYRIEQAVIAIPSASREEMQRVVQPCMDAGIDFKIVPSMRELLAGRARVSELRDVQIEDLLGRDAVALELERVRSEIAGTVVLVTGAAGSIGSELARQVAQMSPAQLVLLDQAETPLFFTVRELNAQTPEVLAVPVIADITDQGRIASVFSRFQPDYVFHAAAYKHVPMMEDNPIEAVRNNILGTLCVAQNAAKVGTRKFVLISTDKAVNPSSVMGATKRVAEQVVLGWPGLHRSGTDFRAVRFGNVLGSNGSVIPIFRQQLAEGKPLTVTHPDVTRYFMTIPEAVHLVLECTALDEAAGRIAMLDMGEPVRITELAENLVRLSGLEPYVDVPIVFTGMRPGEKLHEELMQEFEESIPTSNSKIRIVQTAEPNSDALTHGLDRLATAAAVGDNEDSVHAVYALVPECVEPLRGRAMKAALRSME